MKKCFVLLIICIFVLASCSSKEESYTLNGAKYGNHYGRDYGGHVGDGKFFMMRFADVDELLIAKSPDSFGVILTREYKHKFDGNDLYFYSADGYAVVYAKSNLCKVFITDPPLEEVTGEDPKISGRSPENNYRIDELVGEEFKCIIYLDSFDEFTDYEQKILKELKENVDNENRVHEIVVDFLEPIDELLN